MVPWSSIVATSVYSATGGRDVLILAPDLSLSHPEAVARRPGQLTRGDKMTLHRQGLPSDCQDELDIVRARYDLDKWYKLVDVKSGQSMSRDEVMDNIADLLNTTQNDGGMDVSLHALLHHAH